MTLKNDLRKACLARRALISPTCRLDAARAVSVSALEILQKNVRTAAVYFPVKTELDALPLAAALQDRGIAVCLPVVCEKDAPLIFRLFENKKNLVTGTFGIFEPPSDAPDVTPDVIFAPLVGFDRSGNRLGYGGGYYDRTLGAAKIRPFFVGIAFSVQECAEIPCEKTDFRLDCIVTEKERIHIHT